MNEMFSVKLFEIPRVRCIFISAQYVIYLSCNLKNLQGEGPLRMMHTFFGEVDATSVRKLRNISCKYCNLLYSSGIQNVLTLQYLKNKYFWKRVTNFALLSHCVPIFRNYFGRLVSKTTVH